ncbi:MAG TPA: alpha/beta hydrolase [Solirubrobacteraceae bacterium]|nr:alpha/beta hydrolase [Solirubrobacteraceae bacterium]
MSRRCRWVLALVLAAFAGASAPGAAARAASAPQTLRVGTQTLTLCASVPQAYCGTLAVPLDYGSPAGPDISIGYRWYPASAAAPGQAAGTVVPVEGGPGYPSIGSVAYESSGSPAGYSAMYGPLLSHWNMLAVDNRGTGSSAPLRCPALQDFSGETDGEAFEQTAAGCAAALNHRWKDPDGAWVHASDLFTSAPAAEDLAAVITALQLPKVDLYGDSYGSFFAQVFASRFPQLVRSVILDSTYETVGLDPWYRTTIDSMPSAFDVACSRSPACVGTASGPSWTRIEALAASLRTHPVASVVPGPEGTPVKVSMGVIGLVNLLSDGAEDTNIYRELDASARALLEHDDPAPLLRLYAQRLGVDEAYFGEPVREYSVELYLATSCLDYPQLFDMDATPAVRAQQLAGAEAALPAATFSPFSSAEWIAQDQNTEAYTACLDWPSPTVAQPPASGRLPLFPSSLPVLVLGGELDTWTPAAGVPKVLAEIGGHARFIELANSTHVVGEGDTACGSTLVQEFVADPQALDSLDAACAPAVAPVHTVGVYATQLSEEPPLSASPGNTAPSADLRLAAAAVTTAGDAIARYEALEVKDDHGLAGGTVTASKGGTLLTLRRDRLVPEVAVSGTVRVGADSEVEDGKTVLANLTVKAPGIGKGSFTATWTTAGTGAEAQLVGSVGREPIAGSMPAP